MLFCRCISFLRNSCEVSHASKAVVQAMWTRKYQLLLKEFVSKRFRFPSKATMTRARARIDLAASLIHREEFRHGRYSRPVHGVRTLHVFFDSSPSEGRDVMETIFDVCTSGSQPTMLLLPSCLVGSSSLAALAGLRPAASRLDFLLV